MPRAQVPPRQPCPQVPQLLGSVCKSEQVLPQVVLGEAQAQAPPEHVNPFWHSVWSCQPPAELQSCGTPVALHLTAVGEQTPVHPPDATTQALPQVWTAGMPQVPWLHVPAAW